MKRGQNKTGWSGFAPDRFCEQCYGLIKASFLARWMTAYRRLNRRVIGGGTGDRPLTGWRQRGVRLMERSPLVRGIKAAVQALFDMPITLIGLFGVVYALIASGGLLLAGALAGEMVLWELVPYGVICLGACPLLFSRRPLSETLYRCGITRVLLIWLWGVPKDRFLRPARAVWKGLPVVTTVAALAAGILASQMGRFEWLAGIPSGWYPFLVPLALLLLALVGMILTVPETGVVLSCGCMVLLWMRTSWSVWLLTGVIVVTWVGYIIQILQAHRTLRFDLLDRVVLLFGVALVAGGFTGSGVNSASIKKGLVLFAFLSLYFLIVNLMATRTHIKRCWVGVCMAVAFATVSLLARYINADELRWTESVFDRVGPVISDGYSDVVHTLTQGHMGQQLVFLLLAIPLLLAFLLRSDRLLWQAVLTAFVAADVTLILLSDSRGAWVALLVSLLAFCFLGHHRALTVSLLALPVPVCLWLCTPIMPGWWTEFWTGVTRRMTAEGGFYALRYWPATRDLICAHPAGIGIGDGAYESLYSLYASGGAVPASGSGSLYLELLITLGIPGLLVFSAVAFLFVQKCLTCMRYSGSRNDRVLILGGLTGMLGMFLVGFIRSSWNGVSVFFAFWVVMAILSAYVNIVDAETEALQARSMGTMDGQDYVGRIN